MPSSKPTLFDTNILVYNQDQDSPHYGAAASCHQQANSGKIKAYLSTQNLLEFSSVMMNPKKIKQPLTQNQTTQEIENYLSHPKFHLISPTSHTATIYTSLLQKYPLKNPLQTFDLFLVATMLTHQINRLLTLNTKDFSFIKEITPIPLK